MATITKRATKGSPLTNDEVDANFENLNTDKLETSGGSVTGDISFGDNDKAIFGAGDDLQIYHDGSHSYIDEQGTGSLQIRATNLNLKSSTNETYIGCVADGQVEINYNNSLKLATTNTGIDVTGTVTADGLTVDTDTLYVDATNNRVGVGTDSPSDLLELSGSTAQPAIRFTDEDVAGLYHRVFTPTNTGLTISADTGNVAADSFVRFDVDGTEVSRVTPTGIDVTGTVTADGLTLNDGTNTVDITSSGSDTRLGFIADRASSNLSAFRFQDSSGGIRLNIADGGDISFYEDTGTTAKFFWDAADEYLGIGTTPGYTLDVENATDNGIARFTSGDADVFIVLADSGTTGAGNRIGAISDDMYFKTASTTRMTIDSSGNVGIGEDDPQTILHTYGTSSTTYDPLAVGGQNTSATLRIQNASTAANTFSSIDFNTNNNRVVNRIVSSHGSTTTGGFLAFITEGSGVPAEAMRIDSDGSVGIGTTSPDKKLEIVTPSTDTASIKIVDATDATATYIGQFSDNTYITNNTTYSSGWSADDSGVGISSINLGDGTVSFSTASAGNSSPTTRMRIDSSGNLGIGTTSPSYKTEIADTISGTFNALKLKNERDDGAADALNINFNLSRSGGADRDAGEIKVGKENLWDASPNCNSYMSFSTMSASSASEAMRIDSSGNVGIGTSSPVEKLEVFGDDVLLKLRDTSAYSAGTGPVIAFQGKDSNENTKNFSQIRGISVSSDNGALAFDTRTGGSIIERMRIDSSGNVGIGTTPHSNSKLHILDSTSSLDDYTIHIEAYTPAVVWQDISGASTDFAIQVDGSAMMFRYGDASTETQLVSEAMRIDSSGNLMVGTTSLPTSLISATSGGGIALDPDSYSAFNRQATSSGQANIIFNQTGVDSQFLQFRKDGSTVGSIGCASDFLYIQSPRVTGGAGLGLGNSQIYPCGATGSVEDNTTDLGIINARFDDIFATNGTIQTSDRNEKQDIEELSEAEQRVAVAAKGLLRKFRWIDSVEEKGDDARIHFGIIAQDLQAAFEAEGLDAGRYAMFIHSTWTDEETGEERSRMGVRYSELLAFIIAAI